MEFEKTENKKISETVYAGTHRSGLKIYLVPKKFKKSYACFATKYGSIDNIFTGAGEDKPSEVPDGIAHFLEHKLFEKPDGGNAFDDYSKTGGNANAYTSFNLTSYLFSSTSRFYENFKILLETVTQPYFTDENVAKEQGIIAQEIKMYEDNPDWRVFFNLLESFYHNHPVRRDIAGTVESISKIDKELLFKCYNTFYHPSNMVLFVAGDIDIDKIVEMVDQHVEKSNGRADVERVYPKEPAGVSKSLSEQKLSVAAPIFLMGFKDDDVGYDGLRLLKKEIEMDILLEMLLGRSGEVYEELYETGLINDSFSKEFTGEKDYAYSAFGGESGDPIATRDVIMKGIKNFTPTNERFSLARGVIEGRFLRLFNGIERMGNNFVSNILNDINILHYPEVCEKISLQDIAARFEQHFKEDNMAISIIRPY